MRRTLLGLGTLALAVTMGSGQTRSDAYTVGDLAVRLASAVELHLEEPSPSLARTALATLGLRIDADLKAPLVEEDAVAIFNQLGFHLSTSNPARPVTEEKAAMLVKLIRLPLPLTAVSPPPKPAPPQPAPMPEPAAEPAPATDDGGSG
ncbi:MAG: hypothetical protein PVF68_13105 [Acidobacteriota bacterium]|jgi:hypothetical protein